MTKLEKEVCEAYLEDCKSREDRLGAVEDDINNIGAWCLALSIAVVFLIGAWVASIIILSI